LSPVFRWSLLLVWVFAAPDLGAQPAGGAAEYEVKAGYLYNFTKYVEWPARAFAHASAALVIGVLGDDPFGAVLDVTVQGRTSQDRAVTIRRAHSLGELRGCQVIFLCRSEQSRVPAILTALRGVPVVTVCDAAAAFEAGVMINLTLVAQTVRFEVRLAPAERAGLRFNSRMLAAAGRVWRNTPEPAERP
jgi:hypothetical protein